jgi:two-component system, OmpR family, sensor kinase
VSGLRGRMSWATWRARFDWMANRVELLVAAERRLLLDNAHELRSPLARLGVDVELAR